MRILSYSFDTTLEMDEDVRDHSFVLRCQPPSSRAQTVLDGQTVVDPGCTLASQTDGFGNLLQVGRVGRPHRTFTFYSAGMVVVDDNAKMDVPAHPMYRNPSAYAAPDEAIRAFAKDVLLVRGNAPAWDKAQLLSHALYEYMAYEPGVTDVRTPAAEAFALGRGVCQDYAHILIALLRACGIPARYVNGLMMGHGATHAWVEVHDGRRWRGIDPTNDRVADEGYITLAHGRDFSDCPIEQGVFRGGARQSQAVQVVVEEQRNY